MFSNSWLIVSVIKFLPEPEVKYRHLIFLLKVTTMKPLVYETRNIKYLIQNLVIGRFKRFSRFKVVFV